MVSLTGHYKVDQCTYQLPDEVVCAPANEVENDLN